MDADLEKFKAVMALLSTGGTSGMLLVMLYGVWKALLASHQSNLDDLRKNQRPAPPDDLA